MFTKLLFGVLADPAIAPYYNIVKAYVLQYKLYVAIAAAVLVLILGFFGQRMFKFIRWLVVFAGGFIAGAAIVTPMLKVYAPSANPILIGILCGLVLAVLSGFIYNVIFVLIIGFDVFNICFNALFFPFLETFTKGDAVISAGVTLACIVLGLIFRKYAEMAFTAGVAGFGLPILANRFVYDFTALIPISHRITLFTVGIILTGIMFLYQFKHRVRYK